MLVVLQVNRYLGEPDFEISDRLESTLSRRWRLKKQTFARYLELRSGGLKQPTVSSVAMSVITIGIGGPRHLSLFGARRRARKY